MAKPRGRKPDPPELRAAKLNAGRTAGPFAILRDGGRPEKPETIADDPLASAIWDRTVSQLTDRSILSPADEGVLVAYCSAYCTVIRCRREMAPSKDPDTGEWREPVLTVSTASGDGEKAHPLLGVLSGAERSLASFASDLGLTPTARGRVKLVEDLRPNAAKPAGNLGRFVT